MMTIIRKSLVRAKQVKPSFFHSKANGISFFKPSENSFRHAGKTSLPTNMITFDITGQPIHITKAQFHKGAST